MVNLFWNKSLQVDMKDDATKLQTKYKRLVFSTTILIVSEIIS